jgi:hypothetical protein
MVEKIPFEAKLICAASLIPLIGYPLFIQINPSFLTFENFNHYLRFM